ncbi:unnamed protein product [Didymodactylos carnosus]|uniref:AIG1-type G domain-containing protein n=1 Tax=Didymodactylos carnosus TaxID=1234261 RepID=A0A814HM88_9BILA|nr:unnamed protein product [Didymodactylos carnosus]CAF3784149.1 unnamed protein product [Didymodactylos carnosus]
MIQINCILLGKTDAGKTTLIETLKNPEYVNTQSTLYTATNNVASQTITVASDNNKLYEVKIVDTPGLNDVRNDIYNQYSNEEKLKLIRNHLFQTDYTFIGLVFDMKSIIQEDLASFRILREYLGETLTWKTLLIITHCENKRAEDLRQFDLQLQGENLGELVSFCKLGHVYTGALNSEVLRYSGVREPMLENVMKLRKDLLAKVISFDKSPPMMSNRNRSDEREPLILQRRRAKSHYCDCCCECCRDCCNYICDYCTIL